MATSPIHMSWVTYLPQGWLSTIEGFLYVAACAFAILSAVCALSGRHVAAYRASLEIASVRGEVTDARKETETARREAAEIRAGQEPRRLYPAQQGNLVALLSPARGTEIMVTGTVGNLESMQYATQLADALRRAGWNVTDVGQWDVYFRGVCVLEQPGAEKSDSAALLRQSLRQVGVEVHPKERPEPPEVMLGQIHLAVGSKP